MQTQELPALPPGIQITVLQGPAILAAVADVAALRIAVFRDWPYLYDGTEAYERRYLLTYAQAAGAAVIVVREGDRAVGASTCLPLAQASEDVRAPFRSAGEDIEDYHYFGESVLLAKHRGQGLGLYFFALREALARDLGRARYCTFCAVERPTTSALRPAGAVPLDGFWQRRGYRPSSDLVCTMRWKDIDQADETDKQLRFWIKPL